SLCVDDWSNLRTAALQCRRPRELPAQYLAWLARVRKRRWCRGTLPENNSLRHRSAHQARDLEENRGTKRRRPAESVDGLDLPPTVAVVRLPFADGSGRHASGCLDEARGVSQVRGTRRRLRLATPVQPKERPRTPPYRDR